MRKSSAGFRSVLLAGASALAIAAISQNVSAADLPARMPTKAPAVVSEPAWTWWIEGGAFGTAGQAVGSGPILLPFTSAAQAGGFRPNWGWEGAIGFDYRLPAYDAWHVSAQFRYGAAKRSKPYASTFAGAGIISTTLSHSRDLQLPTRI